jgi:glycosyltransferase involved in cell wall biosynthesis
MSLHKIGVCMPTFNSQRTIDRALKSILNQDPHLNINVYIVDDGSTDSTPDRLKKYRDEYSNINIFLEEHKERGFTRKKSIDVAINDGCDFILFIDSDMSMSAHLIKNCLNKMTENNLSALIIPEKPYSEHNNYMTNLKIFERHLVNSSVDPVDDKSIEAARFWATTEYIRSGEIDPKQISFEEIQPTIRILEKGGVVGRVTEDYIEHDEGHVKLTELVYKKYYYFSQMNKTLNTEKNGPSKAASRWYFFRSYLYKPQSLVQYLMHPHYFIGLFSMYICLSFVAVFALVKNKYD